MHGRAGQGSTRSARLLRLALGAVAVARARCACVPVLARAAGTDFESHRPERAGAVAAPAARCYQSRLVSSDVPDGGGPAAAGARRRGPRVPAQRVGGPLSGALEAPPGDELAAADEPFDPRDHAAHLALHGDEALDGWSGARHGEREWPGSDLEAAPLSGQQPEPATRIASARTPRPPATGAAGEVEGGRQAQGPSAEARARLGMVPPNAPFPLGPFARKRRGAATPRSEEETRLASGQARDATTISPRMTAVFGGLFGLATVASVFALLIQIFPVKDRRAEAEAAASEHAEEVARTAAGAVAAAPTSRKRVRAPLPGPWRISSLKGDASIRVVSNTMQRRGFINALSEAKVPKAQAYRIMKALEGVRKFDRCGNKDRFTVALKRVTSDVVAFEYEVSPTEIYQARTDDQGLLRGDRLDLKVRDEEVVVSFYVGKDVKKSYETAGFEAGLLDELDDAFNGRTSSAAFKEGGVVRAVAVEETALGMFVRYKRLVTVEYRPPDPAEEPSRAYYLDTEGTRGYVDERGRRPAAKGWRTPVPGAPMTSPFNPKRMHPVLHKVMAHQGTDFGAPSGTPVYAAFRGTIDSVGPAGAAGNLVTIKHEGGITTGYAHLSRFAAGLKVGMKVGTRQLVGYVGTTGRSTGPHLHFSAKKNGAFFDPMSLKLDAMKLLPVIDRGPFLAVKADLDARLEAIPLPEPLPELAQPAADESSDEEAPPSHDGDDEPAPSKKATSKPTSSDEGDGESLTGADLSREPE